MLFDALRDMPSATGKGSNTVHHLDLQPFRVVHSQQEMCMVRGWQLVVLLVKVVPKLLVTAIILPRRVVERREVTQRATCVDPLSLPPSL